MTKKVAGRVQPGRNPHLWFSHDSDAEGQFSPDMPWFDRVRHVPEVLKGMMFPIVADIGSNSGGMGKLILDVNPTATLIGVDLAAHLLPLAKAKGYRDVVQADACALPFKSAYFDVVILSEILEHVPDPEATVAEAARVLRPGGLMLGDVPTWFGAWGYRSLYGHKWHIRTMWKRQLWALLNRHVTVTHVGYAHTRGHRLADWYTFEARIGGGMSKASEFAAEYQRRERHYQAAKEYLDVWVGDWVNAGNRVKISTASGDPLAIVTPGGGLVLESVRLTPTDALRLATWIVEQFSDTPVTGGEPGLGQ